MITQVTALSLQGLQALPIQVEVSAQRGIPKIVIIGLATKAVEEAKERLLSALKALSIRPKSLRMVINLSPADIKKSGTHLDLAMAVALLHIHGLAPPQDAKTVFIGELGLDGTIRPIRGALALVLAAKTQGIKQIFVPIDNTPELAGVDDVSIYPVHSLQELLEWWANQRTLTPLSPHPVQQNFTRKFPVIYGQELAIRGLTIAAAGNHHLLLSGPPGVGKSLLARALGELLPPLSPRERQEVTAIHSLASPLLRQLYQRPVRSPHHSVSPIGLLGGGSSLQPGEITLAHRGVLFLDELPEFSRACIEALRQPLEEAAITITRAAGSVRYPAQFTLVGTANPCPCGFLGSTHTRCTCTPTMIDRYRAKISGPILDRIDLHIQTEEQVALDTPTPQQRWFTLGEQVQTAISFDQQRRENHPPGTASYFNLSDQAAKVSQQLYRTRHLSVRSYTKLHRVARTIANLEQTEQVHVDHVSQAIQFFNDL